MLPDTATVGDLMRLMRKPSNAAIKDRCAAVVERRRGKTLRQVATAINRSVAFVKTWNDRFKAGGARCISGGTVKSRPSKLTEVQRRGLRQRVLAGPRPEEQTRVFTLADIQRIIATEYHVHYSRSAVSRLMRRLGLVRLRPRPRHEKQDPGCVQQWLTETLPATLSLTSQEQLGKRIEVWFQDESRFGQKTRAVRVWAERGSRPSFINQNGFKSAYIFGAVNPITGARVGLVTTHCDSDIVQLHLLEISKSVADDVHVILVLDGAGWHHAKTIRVPSNMTLCHLPPYSPELNPIERLWLRLKEKYLSLKVFRDTAAIIAAGVEAWNMLTPADVMSICRADFLPARP